MTDLDRRIAEAKGYPDPVEVTEFLCGACDFEIKAIASGDYQHIGGGWSTSDSKALELVDELRGKFAFYLSCSPSGIHWYATLSPVVTGLAALNPPDGPNFTGDGISRPEAICRAYLAAVEWMKARRG